MGLYKCELVSGGAIKERFFREGESSKIVQEQLDLFQFGKGRWRITPADDEENDKEDEGPSVE